MAATPSSKAIASSSPASILKRPKAGDSTTSTKRKSPETDLSLSSSPTASDPSDEPPRSKKHLRVQFDESTLRPAHRTNKERNPAVVREEVRRAIQQHLSGAEDSPYILMREMFRADPRRQGDDDEYWVSNFLPSHTTLRSNLMGLLSNVAALDRGCSSLVHAIIDSQWLGRDESYVKLYIRFLGNLAAAQQTYLAPVLRMLVNYLTGIPKGTGRLPGYHPVTNPECYTRVHTAIRHIVRLVPSGSGVLSNIAANQFPFDTDPVRAFIAYTRSLVKIVSYTPELRADILALLTEKLVKIDVQIQVDMDDFEEEMGQNFMHEISSYVAALEDGNEDEDEDDDDDNLSTISDDALYAENRRFLALKHNVCKLDGMLDILFEYYTLPFANGTLDDQENALDLLMSHFQNIILPTYHSRHPQFLLFHFSQSNPLLADRFAAVCVELFFNKLQPGVRRQSAAAYLASFVARGAHVSGEVVRDVFELLVRHMERLRAEYEPACQGPELRRYSQFYSTAQALLYIFCFRWRDLTTAAFENDVADVHELDPEDVTFPASIKEMLLSAIYSKLNPLKVCSPGIVTEFSRIAQHLGFISVFSLLETNKRLRITGARNISALTDPRFSQVEREIRADNNDGYHRSHQLDAYFPFDPYHLPRSRRWLEGDYVEWRGIPGLHDQDDRDSEIDDEEMDD